ncbi:MAG: PBSX family phage terminase large subunit [Candidatus Micrarchaeota archaeon]|nr:PBSX family phage terminase large subunit [Candidatus Micrarchaeota archaeon]
MPDIEFPAKLQFLFGEHRYKVAHGGRGSAKSWSFARALLAIGASKRTRILCTREVQKSIKDSVHKLLSDQVEKLGLGKFYEVTQATIRGRNGTEFLFAGLSDQSAESIKSFEGVDIVWVEEAQALSDRSWTILIPTIRKEGSEIWVSFNPELDTDPTWVRFVETPPPGACVVEVNYHDNPWFPAVLEAEREHAQKTLPKADYENIWEGKCRPTVKGAIYAEEVAAAMAAGNVCTLPYDPSLKVHLVFDLGWNDAMSIILVQRHLSQLRVIDYIEDSHKTYEWYSTELRRRTFTWGTVWMPHDAGHANPQTGKTSQQVMQELGWSVQLTPQLTVEEGIRLARRGFAQTYFDKDKAARLIQCLKRYRRGIPSTTGEPGAPVHDEWSHGADAFRYLHVCAPSLSNEDWGGKLNYPSMGIV